MVALSRFGEFGNLPAMRSMAGDLNPNTATFTFYRSEYNSALVNFTSGNPSWHPQPR